MLSKVVILDIGLGNVKSIINAFASLNIDAKLSCNKAELLNDAHSLIIPGVGAFGEGMSRISQKDLAAPITQFAASGRPILGICLGMQMLFDSSNEFGHSPGLGLIPGKVEKLPLPEYGKLPNIGWGKLQSNKAYNNKNSIISDELMTSPFYFVHSFAASPTLASHTVTHSEYQGGTFSSTVNKDNIWGCQYHPEKSGANGLKLLENFAQQQGLK